ncbi:MAG TPA: hypothetical protein VGA67_04700 [Candidatus Dojkabacteria bacterium]|jgi:hypothetical protein
MAEIVEIFPRICAEARVAEINEADPNSPVIHKLAGDKIKGYTYGPNVTLLIKEMNGESLFKMRSIKE